MYGDGDALASHSSQSIDYCKEVRGTLDKSNIITFDTCLKALKTCSHKLDKPENQDFVNSCIMRIINILVSESSIRIGVQTSKIVDESLSQCISILVNMNPRPPYFIDAISKLFDKSGTYYAGVKSYSWNTSTGMAQTRINIINKFGSLSGFEIINNILTSAEYKWMGSEQASNIIAAISELSSPSNTNEITESIISTIVQQVLHLSEEQLKKENHDSVSHIMQGACTHYRSQHDSEKCRRFYSYWKEYTMKLFTSSSLVLKLSAWDQMNELIKEASSSKPPAKRYRVYGAGSEDANGVYEIYKKEEGVYWYQKQPTSPTMPLMTLFRCVMRNKAKHWFISILDKLKPCTPDDVDYYTFKSDSETEGEPQLSGWHRCGTVSLEPAPLLEALELLLQPGESEEDFLISSLPSWIEKTDVLTNVFGQSIHRELVARSTRLVKFLADIKCLKTSHLKIIWKAVASNNETEVLDELLSLLAIISKSLQPELYAELIDMVLETFHTDASGGVNKTVLFLEKCQREYGYKLASFPDVCTSKLQALSWTVYMSPAFDSLKNPAPVQEILSLCLNSRTGSSVVSSYATECMGDLIKLSKSSDEASILRLINALCFLLINHTPVDILNDESFHNFPEIMVNEIQRFSSFNREALANGKIDSSFVSDGLFKRFKLVRQYYNLSPTTFASTDILHSLFKILNTPLEIDEFSRFLKTMSNKSMNTDIVCDNKQCEDIFRNMLCSSTLEWATCGDTTFDCFNGFFSLIVQRNAITSEICELGLKTLWSIMLNISSASSAEIAIDLLTRTYSEFEQLQSKFVPTIFDVFAERSNCVSTDPLALRHIDRLVDLIIVSVLQKKSSSLVPHSAHGQFNRINIIVHHRRVTQYYNYSSMSDKGDRPTEGNLILNVDNMHTLYQLKQKIATELDFYSTRKISIEYNGRVFLENGSFIGHLGFFDGCEVNAILHVNSFTSAFEDDEDVYVPDHLNIATLISNDEMRFNLLVDTAEAAQLYPQGTKAALNIWKLLTMIPTHSNFYEIAKNCESDDYTPWLHKMISTSTIRYTYALQIIDALLQMSPEDCTEESMIFSAWFKTSLVTNGGFNLLLREFITPPSNHILSKFNKTIALHIIMFYLIQSAPDDDSLSITIFDEVKNILSKLLKVCYLLHVMLQPLRISHLFLVLSLQLYSYSSLLRLLLS